MSRTMSIGITSALGAAALVAYATLGGPERQPDQVEALPYVIGFTLVIAAIVFGLVVPWAEKRSQVRQSNRPAKAGLVSSVLAVLTIVAFWSGLPIVLGGAGVALGMAGQEHADQGGRTLARSAVLVGLAAVVFSIVISVWDHAS